MTTVVTKDKGATAKPVGLLYIEPDRQVLDASAGTALADTGMNAPFLADVLSSMVAHERCGVHLYRSVAGRTTLDELRTRYEEFLIETEEHVRLLEELIVAAGGNPMYVSASARATERADAGLVESTWVLEGSLDPMTAELAMLEAVILGEVKCRDNWELLGELASMMPAGELRDLFGDVSALVLRQEEEHYEWPRAARRELLMMELTGSVPPPRRAGPNGAPESGSSKAELYEAAKELGIPGRSSMTKEQLAAAVAAEEGTP